jgi:hypothetical protein
MKRIRFDKKIIVTRNYWNFRGHKTFKKEFERYGGWRLEE